MSEKATGTVTDYFDKTENKPYMVTLNDEDRYSTFDSVDNIEEVSEGDVVKIEWFENDSGYKTIDKINILEGGQSEDGATRETQNDSSIGGDSPDQREGNSGGKSAPILSKKDQRILVQVAFKEACETARLEEGIVDQGKHLDQDGELTNGYYNLLEEQIKDKVSEE